MDSLQQQAHDLGIDQQVTFHGWCETAKVKDLILQSRAVVVPSIWHEPAGLVTLEAAAAGRAVIASRVGGIPEYADSSFARLVPPNDIPALADELTFFATTPARATEMGRAGLECARTTFSMRSFLNKMHGLYELAQEDTASRTSPSSVPS